MITQQNLKTKKVIQSSMSKLTFSLSIFFLLTFFLLNVNTVSALNKFHIIIPIPASFSANSQAGNGVQFFQEKRFLDDNVTSEIFSSVQYGNSVYNTVSGGNPYQTYISYHTNIESWNNQVLAQNLTSSVKYCTLSVEFQNSFSNGTTLIYQINITDDQPNGQYFVNSNLLNSYYTRADCVFDTPQGLDDAGTSMPMDFTIVTPTYQCRACQFYNWMNSIVQSERALTLQDYTTANLGYISSFFGLVYEIFYIGFWVFLILLLLTSIGLIFLGMYWAYNLLFKLSRKIR